MLKAAACMVAIVMASSLFLVAAPASAATSSGQGGKGVGQVAPRDSQRSVHRRNASANERKQRLSQEERRSLRRDIKDAGRQIYRPRAKQPTN